jgi:hypothetical protein
MSGYITRNALMTDNPTFGPPAQSPTSPVTLTNQLGTPSPLALGTTTAPAWGAPPVQPNTAGGLTHDDVAQALGMLYGQLGGGVDWVKATGGPQGPLGQAPTAAAGAGAAPGVSPQQPSPGGQALYDAYKGFQQYQDINQQIQQAKRLFDNPDGGYHGREGGGLV